MSEILAIGASIAWGCSHFLGGLKTKSVSILLVLAVSHLAALIAAIVAIAIVGSPMPTDPRLLLGLAAGVLALGDLGLIYFVLSRGPVVLIAPIAAGGGAISAIVGLVGGDPANLTIVLGLVLALAGSFAASLEGDHGLEGDGYVLSLLAAIGAACGIGLTLVLVERASRADPLWATGALRFAGLVSVVLLLAVVIYFQRSAASRRFAPVHLHAKHLSVGMFVALAMVGVLDVGADIGYSVASTIGNLSTVAVLASLYPAVTVVLGRVILHERVNSVQLVGVVLSLVGIACLAAS